MSGRPFEETHGDPCAPHVRRICWQRLADESVLTSVGRASAMARLKVPQNWRKVTPLVVGDACFAGRSGGCACGEFGRLPLIFMRLEGAFTKPVRSKYLINMLDERKIALEPDFMIESIDPEARKLV